MKKILLALLIFIACFLELNAQNYKQRYYVPNPYEISCSNVTDNPINNGWGVYGEVCAGCPSYYYKITRSNYLIRAENGNSYYYYYIWFFTNSYYSNGAPASTYLTNISTYLNGSYITSIEYALATNQEQYFIWLRTINPYSNIIFKVNKMSVY